MSGIKNILGIRGGIHAVPKIVRQASYIVRVLTIVLGAVEESGGKLTMSKPIP